MKIVLITLLLTLCSCSTALRIAYGIRQPRIETNQSLKKFTAAAGIEDTLLLHIDSISSYSVESEINAIARLPALEFYSPEGVFTGRLEGDECSNLESKVRSIVFEAGDDTAGRRLADVLHKFETADGRKITLENLKSSQAIVCIYYTKALGKIAKDAIASWPAYMKKHDKYNGMRFLFLNIDMHESWGIQSRDDDRYLVFEY